MSFSIIPTPPFERELKKLAKKYISVKRDFSQLLLLLKQTPALGTPIGNNCFKIRMAISSKGRGKSAGARVITYVRIVDQQIYLLSVYDKSETTSITDKEILMRISTL